MGDQTMLVDCPAFLGRDGAGPSGQPLGTASARDER